jgi:hypothetical protein
MDKVLGLIPSTEKKKFNMLRWHILRLGILHSSMYCQVFHCTHIVSVLFMVGLGFELSSNKAGALPPEPHFQSILLWLLWRWIVSYLPRLTSNRDPPNLSLPSSQDDRHEPPVPSIMSVLYLIKKLLSFNHEEVILRNDRSGSFERCWNCKHAVQN